MSDQLNAMEWQTLQQQFHDYERMSLVLKIVSGATSFYFAQTNVINAVAFALFFWGLDAIWKTFQLRIGDRLMVLESGECSGMNLHTHWQRNRPGAIGLLQGYAISALRPTIMMPHALLVALLIGLSF
ncbi:hypothetical protein [Echinimonas agarilytica]|uniref:Uncharacterized protein n=1 Tax=Echinimonas agarilytica TaxID=1215918 RepID=A0AA41W5P0_9GAMM|nr:hypothetical protein [Echinimonas agarilytica]MCM2679052.1 hypothetical protein [Echinimonas agarilytica]